MRRIGRYILNGLTMLSLVLCAATCVLWWRSYRSLDDWAVARAGGRFWHLSNDAGWLDVDWFGPAYPEDVPMRWRVIRRPVPAGTKPFAPSMMSSPSSRWEGFGVTVVRRQLVVDLSPVDGRVWWDRQDQRQAFSDWIGRERGGIWGGPLPWSSPMPYTWLRVPHWMLALLTALLPLMLSAGAVIRSWLRSRNAAAGCCPVCSYDLRASPDRCPECGRIAGEAQA